MGLDKRVGFSIEAVLRILILLGFALFFNSILLSGKAHLYVHPRIIPFIKFSIGAMILISLLMVGDIFKPGRRKNGILSYVFFIVPLIMAFSLPAVSIDSTSMSRTSFSVSGQASGRQNTRSSNEVVDTELHEVISEDGKEINYYDIYPERQSAELKMQGDTINIGDTDFMAWVQELYDNTSKYEGRKIEITGFTYKDKGFRSNEFVAARFMMSCCTADAQVVGLMCHYSGASELSNDTWLKINGYVKKEKYDGQLVPVIEVESVVKVNKPKVEYVYPY